MSALHPLLNSAPQQDAYVLIHVCPVCGQRRQSIARLTDNHIEYLLKFPHSRLVNLPHVFCPICDKEMWLDKIRSKQGKILLDSNIWYNKELMRLRKS